jgi:hypothetical protein
MLTLYQFNLPIRTNMGLENFHALTAWENYALGIAGGYTSLGWAEGNWLSPEGERMRETMAIYQVAGNHKDKQELTEAAKRLFPDQVCFFIAEIGRAELVYTKPIEDAA